MTGEIFKNNLVVPEFMEFANNIEEIFEKCRSNTSGKVSSSDLLALRHLQYI